MGRTSRAHRGNGPCPLWTAHRQTAAMSRHQHPSYVRYFAPGPTRVPLAAPVIESIPDAGLSALAKAERACCCLARLAVVVIMPIASGEHHEADLLLCMHHYRVSQQKLAARGATVLDGTGTALIDRDLWI